MPLPLLWLAPTGNPWYLPTSDYNARISAYIYNQRILYGMSIDHETEIEATSALNFFTGQALRVYSSAA